MLSLSVTHSASQRRVICQQVGKQPRLRRLPRRRGSTSPAPAWRVEDNLLLAAFFQVVERVDAPSRRRSGAIWSIVGTWAVVSASCDVS